MADAPPAKSRWKRRFKKVGLGFLALVAALIVFGLWNNYRVFRDSFRGYQGVRINDTRPEVLYRMGDPPKVLGPILGDGDRLLLTVAGPVGDISTMPPTTTVGQYPGWVFESESADDLLIDFNKANRVERIACMPHGGRTYGCGYPDGLNVGSSEERVLKLGRPTKTTLDGPNKRIEFDDIGLNVYLKKGEVVGLGLKMPKGGEAAYLSRFINTLH